MSDYAKLLRHGQLYIGEHIPERFSTWTRVSLDDSLWLAAHPGLNVVRAVGGSFVLTAIGFLIDPEHPERSGAEIVADLLATPGFTASPFETTYRLGGRWLLVLAGPGDTLAFGDPAGLRQVYLARRRLERPACLRSHTITTRTHPPTSISRSSASS